MFEDRCRVEEEDYGLYLRKRTPAAAGGGGIGLLSLQRYGGFCVSNAGLSLSLAVQKREGNRNGRSLWSRTDRTESSEERKSSGHTGSPSSEARKKMASLSETGQLAEAMFGKRKNIFIIFSPFIF